MPYRTWNVSALPIVLALAAGCGQGSKDAHASSTTGASARGRPDGANGAKASVSSPAGATAASSPGDIATDTLRRLAPNHLGRIPILEYHVIGGTRNALYTRTPESFREDLEDVYRRGYRPITVSQMLDKDFGDVPDGMSPVIVVFDDASAEQFSYVENAGKLEIDSTSGVGIWLDFAKTHPGWKNRATFCMLNGGAAGHNFFGDATKFQGQKKEWRFV